MGMEVAAARLGALYTTSDYASVVSINLFVALLCACIVLGHLLEENRWVNESITALIIGLCTGVVILLMTKGKSSHLFVFSEDLFFIYLLPPIIFNAGFCLLEFYSWSIYSAAIAIFSRMNIGTLDVGDFLAIGAIFSATDSVCTLQVLNQDETPFLYSLVFGEGVVNDATSIVLFNALQNFDLVHIDAAVVLKFLGNFFYLFLSSTFLGVFAGLLSAYIIKKLYIGRHSTDREVALMMLMAYLSYMLAELLDLSGILTVFFCGIVMSHYTWHNVTESSRVTTKHAFATLSFIAETFLFLPGKSIGISSILLGLVLIGRAAFVFPLSFLSNLTKKAPNEKITWRQQVVIWWAGLMRGAVSIALAYNKFTRSGHTQLHGNAIMITSTITVVLFSTMVFGMMTKPLIRLLLPASGHPVTSEPSSPKSLHSPLLTSMQGSDLESTTNIVRPSSLRMLLTKPTHTVHYYWRKFDDALMRPMFGGRGFVPFSPGSPTEQSHGGR
ncbi:hypothetical protein OsI_27250 [Oryza sativa Indica Group]|uniref:Cation/H+ exchanger transmembrane domain-containing protein n=1 Tax=Oryza sativa subsp. indica TaxID=39946 RepID=B8B5V9_ORYSI|nr:hypothetical protein OsI_27250 [Oryza sativa Indica Group]